MPVLVILGVAAVAVVGYVLSLYNWFVTTKTRIKASIQEIGNQLKRQAELIPNLTASVKGYMKHERETMENITKARSTAQTAKGAMDAAKAEGALSAALARFFAVVENYPDLKANQNFLALQEA